MAADVRFPIKPDLLLAILLIALAGFIATIGFLRLGGYFVSFMSGNSTRLAADWAVGDVAGALRAGALVAVFVGGVFVGSLLTHRFPIWHRPAILWIDAALLALVASGAPSGGDGVWPLAAAMGLQNSLLHRTPAGSVGTTYVTGVLVHLGASLAETVVKPSWVWLPHAVMWLALMSGAIAGALAFGELGLAGLYFAVCGDALLAVAVSVDLLPRRG
ncbi:MAG: YoaK family protein [Caulobacteraceae bacterium]